MIGLVVGAVARLVMSGKDLGGILVTMLLGIVGAALGTLLGRALRLHTAGQGAGFFLSVVGAVLVLWIYRRVRGKGTATP